LASSMAEYFISTESDLLDTEFIVQALQGTYWAKERSREVILASMQSSLCFGAYLAGTKQQVGFARVVTDGATFSRLCDVFVDPAHRGHGLGKLLVEEVIANPSLARTAICLGTKDAHPLYEKYGFVRWEHMRRAAAGTKPIQP
jgi:GNAT superfamily N-acetyltransferase